MTSVKPSRRTAAWAILVTLLSIGTSVGATAEDGLLGAATLRYPDGTKAVASFRTADGGGADKLIDGDPQTALSGAEGSAESADKPVWVDLTFGRPVENLLGVATGESDRFGNYYPKQAEFWLDTTGKGEFDTLGAKVKLGPGAKAAGRWLFDKPVAKAHGLRFLVTEQNLAGTKRCFSMNELILLPERPKGAAPAPKLRKVSVPEAGDRHIRMHIVYPKAMLRENGGPVINLRSPPYNAVGDGKTDDTQAFIKVLDFIADEQLAKRRSWIVYVPNGTYLVSDALVSQHDAGPDGFCYFRLVGEDRATTTIRLADKATGFGDPAKPKTLLPWEGIKPGEGNILWGNLARNFTIDTGSGNPGAIAMTFMGANSSSIDNLSLRSGDGQGKIGLHFSWWSVQGHFCDLSIDGFNVGIKGSDSREAQPTLEYVTLTGQHMAGYEVGPHAASIRRLLFRGPVPAVVVDDPFSQTVLIDSRLEGGKDATGAAIVMNAKEPGAQVFLRNLVVGGYPAALDAYGKTVLTGDVVEYVSGPLVRTLADAPTQSMDLPVEEVALVPWESNPDNWACPSDFQGTVVERVQAALNSGKPAICFPTAADVIGPTSKGWPTVVVPSTVRQMDFSAGGRWACHFQIDLASAEPLWVENGYCTWFIMQAPRPIHFRNGRFGVDVETDQPVSVHMQNGSALTGMTSPKACPKNVRLYARSINEEVHDFKALRPNFRVNGGLMWVLGFKTEERQPSFLVENGGCLEVLGGYQNFTAHSDKPNIVYPLVINNDSDVSVIATSYMGRKYPWAVWERRGDWNIQVANDELPRRGSNDRNYAMPLYTGYRPEAVQARLRNAQ